MYKGGDLSYGVVQYDPDASWDYLKRHSYRILPQTPDQIILPGQVRGLLNDRGFARTGKIAPAKAENTLDGKQGFYRKAYKDMGINESPGTSVGTTLVRTDGYSILSLGIDRVGDNRGQISFAAEGNLSQREILRRARAVFPDAFEKGDAYKRGIDDYDLGEEPGQIIDLPPTPPSR